MVSLGKIFYINIAVDKTTVSEEISSLYLNRKFSDLTLVVGGEKLPAHKMVLAIKSQYFENLIFTDDQMIPKSEIVIEGVSLEVFKMLLKYIYKGELTLQSTNFNHPLELLSLAREYLISDLETIIREKLREIPNLENIFGLLNYANSSDSKNLRDFCHEFMDQRTSEVLMHTNFTKLTKESIVKLLKRDNFVAPEIEIFNAVAKWCEVNGVNKNLVVKCVRLSCLTVVQIVSIVWPSQLVDNEILLNAIAEIVDVKPRKISSRSMLFSESAYTGELSEIFTASCNKLKNQIVNVVWNENVATFSKKATVIYGNNSVYLLNGNRDVNKCTYCAIDNENGITIKLDKVYTINHILMSLYDGDRRYYNYYIEVSKNQQTWQRIIDYTHHACRSHQNLHFDKILVRFIRVVGTHNTANKNFHLIFFEADCRKVVPQVVNGIIRPLLNVATSKKKALVIEGIQPEALLDGKTTGYTRSSGFTYHKINSGSNIIIQLAQPYLISTMKLLLADLDNRYYHYYIETSVNKTNWEMVVDRRKEKCRSWQTLSFPEKPVVFIKIVGTYNSVVGNNGFYCVHFECPASQS